MLVVAQNEMLIRPMIHLFGESGHRPRIWTCLFYMYQSEGGVRVCGDAVLRYIWCGFAVISILTRGIAVSKH